MTKRCLSGRSSWSILENVSVLMLFAAPLFGALLFALGWYRGRNVRALAPLKHTREQVLSTTGVDVRDITDELRAAYERVSTMAVQLQTAQRVANVASFDYSVASGLVSWTDELYRTFGMEPTETPPPYADQAKLFDAESWAQLSAAVTKCIEHGEGYELVVTAIRTSGERRTSIACGEALRGSSGKVERVVGTFQDITAREHVVAERNALAERLQLATSAARIGVWEWDIQRGVFNYDPAMRTLYGLEPGDPEPTYESWRDQLHPEDRERVDSLMREVLAGRGQFRAQYRILRRNGELRYVQADAVMTRDTLGRAKSMTGVNWDVTERHMSELALRAASAIQRAILSSAGSAIIATDSGSGLIRSFNRAAEELLGYTAEEVIGKATPDLFHDPAELQARQEMLQLQLGRGVQGSRDLVFSAAEARPESREWTYVRKDGSRVPVLLTVSAIRDPSQEIIGHLSVAADLSMRKQYEAELLSLNKLLEERTAQAESASYAKGMFLANMSHEIRTPIGAITGASYLLGRTKLSAEQHDLLSTIERSATVLLGMVNDVLDLSKIEAQQLVLDSERFELPLLLDDLASLMHAYASNKQIELILDIPQPLARHFIGDRLRLTQVFSNLAVNAIKFTERGAVRVVVRALEQVDSRTMLRFEVHDTGPGIDDALQARLFKPFSQAEQAEMRRFGGTGLGLAIVKELVTLMDGSVGLASRVGEGSLFWCEIPLLKAAESAHPRNLGAELRVLIIEDYSAQRAALLHVATQLGLHAVVAASGEDGITLLSTAAREGRPFDVVVVDWQMPGPGMDGLRTLHEVRKAPALRTQQPAVILTTAYQLGALQSEPSSRLADAILAKPLGPTSFMETVFRVVTARAPDRVSRPITRQPVIEDKRLVGVRVLVADDSEINRTIARRILQLEGATVATAADGTEAVRLVVSGELEFDVVLMDIQMPVEDGVSATARIRTDPRFATLPILALTAGALASERERALAAGMTDFITKPYAPDDLIDRILEHATSRHSSVEAQPKAAEVPLAAEWSEVEGFAIAEVRGHLAGDCGLFRMLTGRLGEELNANPLDRRPRELVACSAWLHRLSGSAGVLCATGLHRAAREAEVAIHKGGEPELERVIGSLYEEIERTRRGIAAIALWNAPLKPHAAAAPFNAEELLRFSQLVRERDLQAFNMFAQVESALATQLGDAGCERLRTAIRSLDFASASEILLPIEQSLPPRRAAGG
jgi:PAS domain S-box-containing protein